MRKQYFFSIFVIILGFSFLSGCATAPKRSQAKGLTPEEAAQLQSELLAKDQQIQDLQYRLQNSQTSMPLTSRSDTHLSRKSKFIRVSGVSVEDIQNALTKAGFDPGPIDGQMGKKTKAAIKAFQRRHNLKADGIVGERTWSYLKS